jgi:hypothetical protein
MEVVKLKKISLVLAVVLTLTFMFQVSVPKTAKAADSATATILSVVIPGGGEWYNSGFENKFPWAECIIGYICFCFMLSSAVDAANGDKSTKIRLDFWAKPVKG